MKLPFATNLSLDSLSERDRRTLLVGGVIAVLLLLYVVIQLDSSVSSAHKRIIKKQADLAWMRTAAPELAAANGGHIGANGQSLLVLVDSSARESGLASALAGSEPAGPGGLSVRLQKAPFDTLIPWLARLSQQNGIRVDTASIETAGSPGLVNAALVLHTD
jgi:type II secretory pathway component PulM